MHKPTAKTLTNLSIYAFAIFLIGGGIDVIYAFQGGEENALLITQPKMTGLSPVAIILYIFGFLSLMLLYWSSQNRISKPELGQKQFWTGCFMLLIVWVLLTVLYGAGNDHWKQI